MSRYLRVNETTGATEEVSAVSESTGAADGGKIPMLDPETGTFHSTFMPPGIGADETIRTASEAISAGAPVRILSTGELANADAALGLSGACIGFAPAAIASGADGIVRFDGTISGLSELTPGKKYYLATTPGEITTGIPEAGSEHIIQLIGTAISATELTFEPDTSPIVRA